MNVIKPLVSIVVPVYNVERYLDQCIDSIISQTYENLDIVLVNDGSTDGCPQLCDMWAERDPRIKVLHQENTGLSGARNKGLNASVGEYIIFLDSDDVISPLLVERCCSILEKVDCEVIQFKHVNMNENGKETWRYKESTLFPASGLLSSQNALNELLLQHVHHYAPLRCVSRSFYQRISFSFPVGRLMEDMSTTYFVYGAAHSVFFLNEELYFYRNRDHGSITTDWRWDNTVDANTALREMVDYVRLNYPDLEVAACSYAVKFLIWCWMKGSVQSGEFANSEKSAELKKWIHRYAVGCRGSVGLINRLKMFLLDTGFLRFISYMAG